MEMQTKRQLIEILQSRVKYKYMTWDLNANNENEKAQANQYVPILHDFAQGVTSLAYNYGIYKDLGAEPLYNDDTNFMSEYNAKVTYFSTIPYGNSLKNTPFNRYASEISSDIAGGSNVKIWRIKGSLIGNFYVGINPIFKQIIGNLTNSRASFLIRLVTNLFLHTSKFRLKDPNGNVIESSLGSAQIAWYFLSDYIFVENGSFYDIGMHDFQPAQLVRNPSLHYPTAEEIANYNTLSDFDIIE